jgi:hypothetical protein
MHSFKNRIMRPVKTSKKGEKRVKENDGGAEFN